MVSTARGSAKQVAAAVLFVVGFASLVSTPAAAPASTFGWKATKGGGTVYLVGSVHLLTKDFYPLGAALESAYTASDLLIEEVDYGEAMASQMQILSRAILPPGQTLDSLLSRETLALVNKRLAEPTGLPLPPQVLKQLKPWMLAVTLLEAEWAKAGFDAELGLDKHFYDRAMREKKPVRGLETAEFQISRLDELPLPLQDRFLAETLKDIDAELASISSLVRAWKNGDVQTIERLTMEDLKEEPVIYERLLVERNRNWLPQIEALFARRTPALVVVGAAHLVGPDGLLKMLQGKGYAIEQL